MNDTIFKDVCEYKYSLVLSAFKEIKIRRFYKSYDIAVDDAKLLAEQYTIVNKIEGYNSFKLECENSIMIKVSSSEILPNMYYASDGFNLYLGKFYIKHINNYIIIDTHYIKSNDNYMIFSNGIIDSPQFYNVQRGTDDVSDLSREDIIRLAYIMLEKKGEDYLDSDLIIEYDIIKNVVNNITFIPIVKSANKK
jgi:hypothetical protein